MIAYYEKMGICFGRNPGKYILKFKGAEKSLVVY
jgi:hypothetical protein